MPRRSQHRRLVSGRQERCGRHAVLATVQRVAAAAAISLVGLSTASGQTSPQLEPAAAGFPTEFSAPSASGSGAAFAATVPDRVLFPFDAATLTPAAQGILDAQLRWLQDNPGTTIRIVGHTDNAGSISYNQALGLRRAQAVRDYFVAAGLSPQRIMAVETRGETAPATQQPSQDAQNRRTVIVVRAALPPALAFDPSTGQCVGPFALAQIDDVAALRDALSERAAIATDVYQRVVRGRRVGDSALVSHANIARDRCSIALGYARGGRVAHPYYVPECACAYEQMIFEASQVGLPPAIPGPAAVSAAAVFDLSS